MIRLAPLLLLVGAAEPSVDDAGDARALGAIVAANYAYLDRLPGGVLPHSPALTAERAAVHDRDSLLHYAEQRIASLADHHAITGASVKDSWAVVPTFADLWIVRRGNDFIVDAVRPASPAAAAGIAAGDRLSAIGGTPTAQAVAAYWQPLGMEVMAQLVGAVYDFRLPASGLTVKLPAERLTATDGMPREAFVPRACQVE